MCTTCGCSNGAGATAGGAVAHGHSHDGHGHGAGAPSREVSGAHPGPSAPAHGQAHGHDDSDLRTIELESEVLARNNRSAGRNREWIRARGVLALNLVSSPGAGKTTLLERTIRDLAADVPVSVVEGDQETQFDAERIRATGARTVQVNTGTGCHLAAGMLARALKQLEPPVNSLLMIENVGNLVCPALFDLGEHAKVVIFSVTEGEDKPLKYPHMFRAARLMILNKIDLLPHVDFRVEACIEHARRVNPEIEVLQLSATTGEGLAPWYDWLATARAAAALDSARCA